MQLRSDLLNINPNGLTLVMDENAVIAGVAVIDVRGGWRKQGFAVL
jgi:hypothetical protein